jgi:VWFA-related protein
MRLRTLRICAGIFLLGACLGAQNAVDLKEINIRSVAYVPRMPTTLKVDATLVETTVVVRDGRGRAVQGLQRGDFEVRDEGKKREIRSFTVQTLVHPRSAAVAGESVAALSAAGGAAANALRRRWIGLLFDDMNSASGDLIRARIAALRFLKEGLQPGDHVAIFTTFDRQLLPFTTDAAVVAAALEKISPHPMTPLPGLCPSLTPYEAYVIINRQDSSVLPVKVEETHRCSNTPPARGKRGATSDAVDDASPDPVVQQVVGEARRIWTEVELNSRNTLYAFRDVVDAMGRLQGERLLLAASSGFLSGTLLVEQDELVNRALRADVVIDALDAKGLYTQAPVESVPGMGVRSAIMQQSMGTRPEMASNDVLATLAYSTGGIFFHNNNDLTAGIREMMAPEVTYRIGFAPDGSPDGKYHKLKVKVNAKSVDVQARPGYMSLAVKPDEHAEPRKIDAEVLSAEDHHDAPASFAVTVAGDDPLRTVLVVLHIDLKNLTFKELFGVHSQNLTYIAALMDQQGNFVTGQECGIDLALKESTLARYLGGGMNLTAKLQAPKGTYRMRGVLEVAGDGKIASQTIAVEAK